MENGENSKARMLNIAKHRGIIDLCSETLEMCLTINYENPVFLYHNVLIFFVRKIVSLKTKNLKASLQDYYNQIKTLKMLLCTI